MKSTQLSSNAELEKRAGFLTRVHMKSTDAIEAGPDGQFIKASSNRKNELRLGPGWLADLTFPFENTCGRACSDMPGSPQSACSRRGSIDPWTRKKKMGRSRHPRGDPAARTLRRGSAARLRGKAPAMESTQENSNAENRPLGASQVRFPSWPRKRPFFARVHMK